jgi:hypothetical protein
MPGNPHSVPDGTGGGGMAFIFYQHIVPNGTNRVFVYLKSLYIIYFTLLKAAIRNPLMNAPPPVPLGTECW